MLDEDEDEGEDGQAAGNQSPELLEDSEAERFPLFKSSPPVVLDAALEEQFTPIVLRHAPRFRSTVRNCVVWKAIVDDSRGRYISPRGAQVRTRWLCKVASDPLHTLHHKLTPTLRDMLLEVRSHWDAGRNDGNSTRRSGATAGAQEGDATQQAQQLASTRRQPNRTRKDTAETSSSNRNTGSRLAKSRKVSPRTPQIAARAPLQWVNPQHELAEAGRTQENATREPVQSAIRGELRELRAELRNLNEELRSQREVHHRETAAMLQLLEKERQDRKEEFTAMMGLVTRFGAPCPAPPAAAYINHTREDCLL